MATYSQASADVRFASELTNAQLGTRLQNVQASPRAYTRARRDAILAEAARRLIWRDAYNAKDTETQTV